MTARTLRCAVYTRKSSEEGLEQDFNSLDAQLEACTAYIASQKHEGWQKLPQRYDDGGWSGGSLERPGLKQLLADVAAGRVDIIVVYKVDRLTRSLADFARIVEILDARKVSFVSVTQQFNTTTSMGRLTLNVLLSFAQFEREVTAERIRDKIAASKAKGMWMGGNVPLGYDVVERKLIVNQAEATQVRHIFERYLAVGAVDPLIAELYRDGYVSKRRPGKAGKLAGGCKFTRGALYTILGNRLYIGEIAHKGKIWPGQHEAIVDRGLWDRVQAQLAEHRRRWGDRGGTTPALFKGLLVDEAGQKLMATYTRRHGRIYRYYVSQPGTVRKMRIPAEMFEKAAIGRLCALLRDQAWLSELPSEDLAALLSRATDTAEVLERRPSQDALSLLLRDIMVREGHAVFRIRTSSLTDPAPAVEDGDGAQPFWEVRMRVAFKRRGEERRLVVGISPKGQASPELISILGKAWAFRREYLVNGRSLREIADEYGSTHGYVSRIVRIAFTDPKLMRSLLTGDMHIKCSIDEFVQRLTCDWVSQGALIGN